MSQQNVEVVRRGTEEWLRGNLEAWVETIDPEVGWEVAEAGEQVILVLHETATMRDTGVPLERDLVQLWTVRGGKGVFVRVFRTKNEALEAAGLRE